MRVRRLWWLLALPVVMLALLAAGCGSDDEGDDAAATTAAETTQAQETVDVTLQLKWVTQGQFAGYYAALEQGYYEEKG